MRIIDFHTHAFPDFLAERAVATLEAHAGGYKAFLRGSIRELLASMDSADIDASVVCSIATAPHQEESILKWSASIASDRIYPFPSIHPSGDPEPRLRRIKAMGFCGVKLHPQYQDFEVDSDKMFPIYETMRELSLVCVLHAGRDIAFPDDLKATPDKIARVLDLFPGLRVVATHMGGWNEWQAVKRHLLARDVYLETSFALNWDKSGLAPEIFLAHRPDRLLFGTDSPWMEQASEVKAIGRLKISDELKAAVLGKNAEELLCGA